MRWLGCLLLLTVLGCESHTNPASAEYIEIVNEAMTAGGETNTHAIAEVQIRRTDVGGLLPHFVDIAPGESQVFSVLWPGEHEITVHYDDGHVATIQQPEDPFWINSGSTVVIHLWY